MWRTLIASGLVLLCLAACDAPVATPSPVSEITVAATPVQSPTVLALTSVPAATSVSATAPALPVATPTTTAPPVPTPSISSKVLSGFRDGVTTIAWSPDGTLLAAASGYFQSSDATIRLWRSDGSLVKTLTGHTGQVNTLAWSPDGTVLASGSFDQRVRLWRKDGTLLRTLATKAGTVWRVTWSPDSKTLAVGSIVNFLNPSVQLWWPDGTLLKTLSTQFSGGKFYNLAYSPDGAYLLGGATDYTLWRSDGSAVYHLPGCASCTPQWALAWSPDSKEWAVGNENGEVEIRDLSGTVVHVLKNSGDVQSLAWSPDGAILAGGDGLSFWGMDGAALPADPPFPNTINSVAWSPDGRMLASGGDDGAVLLWNARRTLLATLTGHNDVVNVVAWSPDSKTLATASNDKTVRLWHIP